MKCRVMRLGHIALTTSVFLSSSMSMETKAQESVLKLSEVKHSLLNKGDSAEDPSQASADLDEDIAPESSTFATPKNPNKKIPSTDNTRPKASQPGRDEQASKFSSMRQGGGLPVPGTPARNLPPLGQSDSSAADPLSAEANPGLLKFVPHSFFDGGLTIECIYTGETFTKAHGGRSTTRATNYRSNLDLVGILDTTKMNWWDNGRFFIYGQNLSGRPISVEEVGDVQLFSNLDSTISDTERPNFTTIAEYWYEHVAIDNRVRFKIGKQDANVDFALTDLGGDFVNSSFGFPPMIPFPTFPSQALGIASFLSATDTLTLGLGIYDGTLPSGPQGVRWGFDTLGHNGSISLYQLEWKPQLGPGGELPTTVRTGMWYHSDDSVWVEFDDVPNPRTFKNNYGHFTSVDQMIWKESFGTDDTQGLGVFFQYGWAPANRNVLNNFYGGGLVYKGLLPNRDNDLLGIGYSIVQFSDRHRAASALVGNTVGNSETAVEVFYKALVKNSMSIQPDLQYIANPSGMYKDALVPGLRFEVVF